MIAIATEHMFDIQYLEGNTGRRNDNAQKMIQLRLLILVTI